MTKPDNDFEAAPFLRGGGRTAALIAGHDWASTSLGPLSSWPQSLRTAAGLILNSPLEMIFLWGEDGVVIYNDAFAEASPRTPPPLGAKAREAWPDALELVDEVLRTVLGGRSLALRDHEITLRRGGKREKVWLNVDCSPVLDENGRPAGVLCIAFETTGRVLAERKAAAQAERQKRLFEEAPGFVCLVTGPDHVVEFVNGAHKRLFGDRDAIGRPFFEVFADLAPDGIPVALNRTYQTGERYFARAEPVLVGSPGAPGEERFLDYVLEPIMGEGGQVTGVFLEGFDVTDSVRAQTAVRESERRLHAALTVARLASFEYDLETQAVIFDARGREIFGFEPDRPLTLGDLIARIDPDDFARLNERNEAATAAWLTRREYEFHIRLPDGAVRNVVSQSDSQFTEDGRQKRVIGVFADVTERRRAEKRQQLLINELNHRVKNTLATVQSIAAQTLRSAPDLEDAREAFDARLVALAAAHDLLTAQSWHGAQLADVAASALAPFEGGEAAPQITRSGPPVWLSAQRALALSLALHELATNAVKHGALSRPEGRVQLLWCAGGDGQLTLSWVESGGPPVSPPQRAGFGSRLLKRGLPHELRGEVALTFAPAGLRCEIRCRVEDAQRRPAAAAVGT